VVVGSPPPSQHAQDAELASPEKVQAGGAPQLPVALGLSAPPGPLKLPIQVLALPVHLDSELAGSLESQVMVDDQESPHPKFPLSLYE